MNIKNFLCGFLVVFLNLILMAPGIAAQETQNWPMEISSPNGKIVIYQPQPETFKNNLLTGRAAVSVTLNQSQTPAFGAIWFDANLSTDLDKRTFALDRFKITKVKFPETSQTEQKEFSTILDTEVPKHRIQGSLDSLLATLETAQKETEAADNFQMTPPKIIYLKYKAQLIYIDGEPKLQAIENSKLMRVVNTPMLIVFDTANKKYYLSSGNAWYSTTDINSDWQIDHNLPGEIASMLTKDGKPVANNIPDADMPRIVVANTPTELIVSNGEPQYSPIKDTNLLYLSNSENDVFLNIDSQTYYVLLSGRWYSSKSLDGSWDFVPVAKLPVDFAKIPPTSVKANVLASVPNTIQAQDALIASEVPQTAVIERSKATLTVKYDDEPKFEKISGTSMKYAVNTQTPVLLIDGKYYACDNAVWFVAPTPNGPWVAADSVPKEVQKIPPESPVYNVKYVYVYDSTPEVIYTGYTAGYLGWYPYYGTIIFGTGYPYPAWYGPYYYPHPMTFGFAVHYNSFNDSWAFGFRWSNGFNTIAFGWNNWWGGHGWFFPGPYIYHPVFANNININRNININNINFPNKISIGNKTFNINNEMKNNIYDWRNNSNRLAPQTIDKTKMQNIRTNFSNGADNVFADKDGQIYRANKNTWQRNDGKKWTDVASEKNITKENVQQKVEQHKASRPSARTQTIRQKVPDSVVRDYNARQRGVVRTSINRERLSNINMPSFQASAFHGGFRR